MNLENNPYYRKFRVFAWIPIIWLIRLLRPFFCVRFGGLFSERIGHFAIETELYLCQKALGKIPPRTIDLFFHRKAVPDASISNMTLLQMFKKRMFIHNIYELLWKANHCAGGDGSAHFVDVPKAGSVEQGLLLDSTECQVEFSDQQVREGEDFLQGVGIGNSPFVCVHSRDSAYLNSAFPGINWDYHNYRDCDINSFVPAMEALTDKGYFVLRMGAVVGDSFQSANPRIIDYSTLYRSDFLDIFLSSRCSFFLGTDSGLFNVAMLFRKKTIVTNYSQVNNVIYMPSFVTVLPKKIWSYERGCCLKYSEVLQRKIGNFVRTDEFEELKLTTICNSPEDIVDVALEVAESCERSEGESNFDPSIQNQFWSLYEDYDAQYKLYPRISSNFVIKNHELFE
ncbi:TIGR04372 family glycosyltransferase [Maridesulfovibrio hydrothermalis]|uniref:Glycosyltransferase, TIGR04372 family n=1 Tax=Maridesulfovibrio hydrothermalis AM13 = DSM 14728 TaxID=1121451 RepID=L0RB99_9BACT|nr:TIGR04372 family glycosyltransferase [Maridesulfovibrio hydrothermalis]CCO23445.1 conserved protein of unknown function [Maridesulfovibrio hydrothermalis AM13 = DSM 14728]